MHLVNTVLGPISADELGMTLMHEHVVFGFPGWYGDRSIAPLDREAIVTKSVLELNGLKKYGVSTIVDATTNDTGRNPDIYKEISEKTGINIICSTGYYYEGEGAPAYFKFRSSLNDISNEIYDMFMKEATEGIENTGIRAGVIKVSSSQGAISDYEKTFFKAAAKAQIDSGVPIITHTQRGTMGPEQADLLIENGANIKHIMIGHMSENTDIKYQMETLSKGVFIAFDRMGIQGFPGCPRDIERCACIIGLIGVGYANRIMMSHDTVSCWLGRPLMLPEDMNNMLSDWKLSHIFDNILPTLRRAGVNDVQVESMMTDNPKRFFRND